MIISQALLLALMLEAAKLSTLPAITEQELPTLTQLSPTEVGDRVCGKNWDPKKHCDKYMAVYFSETNEIIYNNTLNMEADFGKSVMVHELVHALQKKKHGSVLQSCEELISMEKEAYTVQDYYMMVHGHYDTHYRNIVNFLKCPPLTEVSK